MMASAPPIRSRNHGLVASVIAVVGAAGLLVGVAAAGLVYQTRLSVAQARNQRLAVALQQTQRKLVFATAQEAALARANPAPMQPAPPTAGPAMLALASAPAPAVAPKPMLPEPPDRARAKLVPRPSPAPRREPRRDVRPVDPMAKKNESAHVGVAANTTPPGKPEAEKAALKSASADAHLLPQQHPLQAVSAQAAGLRSLDSRGVVLANGQSVDVGGYFPSGEKLISVDPKDNEVVTSRRTLVLFFGRSTHP